LDNKHKEKIAEFNNQNNIRKSKLRIIVPVEKGKKYREYFVSFFRFLYKTFNLLLQITGIYFVWIFLHYIASHFYVKLCAPSTFYGFLISPFLVATPYCIGLRWLICTGSTVINNMWILFGTWLGSILYHWNQTPSPQ
jgi:hypothetical protein